ncbi:MAG: pyridoxamine 5'-phosphate oxidase family protein [Clostridia bacterium]|nr:pyridoxamine 5'-phosphate oxidase family protein [Clostridia bacterium]MBR0025848.1 pyridoxamine 5'-phosphate oxidase family protein [Clostridia bacterium]
MDSNIYKIMNERFCRDTQIVLSTREGIQRWARTVDAYYEDGVFYIITHARSGKIQQIKKNPEVKVCSEGLNVNGIGENLGSVSEEKNLAIAQKLREVFCGWYNGESDPNNCVLSIRLTTGFLFADGVKYELDFTQEG